jgi:hypothetical protein
MNSHKNIFAFVSVFLFALLLIAPLQAIHADDSSTDASSTPTDTSMPVTSSSTPDTTVATSTPDVSPNATSGATTTADETNATTTDASSTPNTEDVATSSVETPTTEDIVSTSTDATTTPNTGTATVTVRDGSVVAWTGTVSFPIGTSTSDVLPTNSTSTVPVLDQSLLGALLHAESSETAFTLSDLEYYSSFGEFLLNCITVPAVSSTPACKDWQYAVDGVYPYLSIDQYPLQNGDHVDLYFGNQQQVSLATSSVSAGESFVATAQTYDLSTGTYVPAPGYTIGVTQPDPNNPWSPLQIATSTADANGNAAFTINTPGSYGVGVLLDDYGDYSSLTPLIVASSTPVASSTDNSGNNTTGGSGGGGGSSNTNSSTGNIPAAFSFLVSNQNSDGSFTGTEDTDWAALALALPDAPSGARAKLAQYLSANDPLFTLATDYERHALALMALGINPYTGSPTDTITPIVKAFNGTHVVDSADDQTNDISDIFALIVLPHAGYTSSDTITQKVEAFVLSSQESNGSWDGNPDLTGAALQALAPLPGTSGAIAHAENYLHSAQQSAGGFSNGDSTSWVLGGLAALNMSPASWAIGTETPLTYLASTQQTDGGITSAPGITDPSKRAWSTAYALTAFEGRSWSSLLGNFPKPVVSGGGATASTTSSDSSNIATTTDATSTPDVAATSTVPFIPVFTIATATPVNPPLHKKLVRHAMTSSSTPFTVSTTSIANAISGNSLTAGVASAPVSTSFWQVIVHLFMTLGSVLRHLF